VARSILTPLAGDGAARELLARAHLKLGDVQKLNGQFQGSLADYAQCLSLRRTFLPPHDRGLADVHYQLAQTAEYAAADVGAAKAPTAPPDDGAGTTASGSSSSSSSSSSGPSSSSSGGAAAAAALRAQSLAHYEACRDVFQLKVRSLEAKAAAATDEAPAATPADALAEARAEARASDAAAAALASLAGPAAEATGAVSAVVPGLSLEESAELADFVEILKELHETIASARDGSNAVDVRSVLPSSGLTAAHGTAHSGAVSLGAENTGGTSVTTIGFGSSSSSSGSGGSSGSFGEASTVATQVMLVAKKKKRAAPELAEAAAEAQAAEAPEANKAKHD
jgi:uncharacterized membrane protein YgcG